MMTLLPQFFEQGVLASVYHHENNIYVGCRIHAHPAHDPA